METKAIIFAGSYCDELYLQKRQSLKTFIRSVSRLTLISPSKVSHFHATSHFTILQITANYISSIYLYPLVIYLVIRLASHPTLYSSFFCSLFWNSWSVSRPLYRDYENQSGYCRQESYDHSDNHEELHSLDFPDIFSRSIQRLWWRLSSVAAILIGISHITSLYSYISRRLVLNDVFVYFINSCFGLQLEVEFVWPCWCRIHGCQPKVIEVTFKRLKAFKCSRN